MNRFVLLLLVLRVLLGVQAARSEIVVDGPIVRVEAEAYYAKIDIKRKCTAQVTYYLRKGSLAETVEKRNYWTDDRISEFCPDPKAYGSEEIPRGHVRALFLTPVSLERDANYAANLIPVFRAANLEMLNVDRKIKKWSGSHDLMIRVFMQWDDNPRILTGTDTDIPDTINYVICKLPATETLLEVTIQNKE